MLKKILSIIMLALGLLPLWAQEYKIPVFHNNMKHFKKIDKPYDFAQKAGIALVLEGNYPKLGRGRPAGLKAIYEEEVAGIKFYRCFYNIKETEQFEKKFKNAPHPFTEQALYYEWDGCLYFADHYPYYTVVDTTMFPDVATKDDDAQKTYPLTVGFRDNVMPFKSDSGYGYIRYQIYDWLAKEDLREAAFIYLLDEAGTIERIGSDKMLMHSWEISCSVSLKDKANPFRYTIQNAFDGNPATSYVEDTKDNLMEISFQFDKPKTITKIKIINGYAENMDLYKKNNRIKKISFFIKDNNNAILFEDNMLNEQVFTFKHINTYTYFQIFISDVYYGSKWSDTCLAELDICTEEDGWLFGGKDE